jgi:4-amino-4-deoxy-L-arabinose transferase-like glycosyltransferase
VARRAVAFPELIAVLAVAGFLNLWNLSINGDANTFYAAAVKSMAASWHDFLFNSMDKAGLMTVDKPPLADWIEALSVRIFGFNSYALLAPQAVMGIIAAGLMYDLVRRRFGRVAGFAAGIVLATTPTIVAVSRHNNPDELLVLLSVAATWCFLRALETQRTKWMVWTGVCIGLGFETKMGVALMLVPAFALAWAWTRYDRSLGLRGNLAWLRQLLLGGVSLAVVGLAWPVLMWLTPAADRPWISGTSDNSIWSLIVGYNGLGRVGGQAGGPGGFAGAAGRGGGGAGFGHGTTGGALPSFGGGAGGAGARAGFANFIGRAGGPGGGAGGGGNTTFGGNTGVFRLLNDALGSQAGWLLGGAVVAIVALIVLTRLRRRDPNTGFLIAIAGTLVVVGGVFSFASGIFHPYYVSMVAPWAAALIGAGVGLAVQGRYARLIAPALLAGALVTELIVLGSDTGGDLAWARWVAIAGTAVCGVLLILALSPRVRLVVLTVGCAALLAAPATWAAETLGHATSSTFPTGGPASASGGFGGGGFGGGVGFAGLRARFAGAAAGSSSPAGPGAAAGGSGLSSLFGSGTSSRAATSTRTGAGAFGGFGSGGFGGGGFGGSDSDLNAAAAWVAKHGGGTVAVESQSTAATAILAGHTDVAGIGGFSGEESSVTLAWIEMEVREGRLSYILNESAAGFADGRTGSAKAIAAAEKTATKLTETYDGQTFTLYRLKA